MTLEEAKALKPGDKVFHATLKNADNKTARMYTVTGQVKIWKRDAGRVRVPVKRGLKGYDYIDENSLHLVNLG